jgi:ribosomal protein L2
MVLTRLATSCHQVKVRNRGCSLPCNGWQEVGNAEQRKTSTPARNKVLEAGKLPTVRGAVANPVDHPHGGAQVKVRHPVDATQRQSPL